MLGSLWESSPEDFEILKLGNTTFIWFFFFCLKLRGSSPLGFAVPDAYVIFSSFKGAFLKLILLALPLNCAAVKIRDRECSVHLVESVRARFLFTRVFLYVSIKILQTLPLTLLIGRTRVFFFLE